MTVGELKLMLANVPDDLDVLISATGEFDGMFVSPCLEESGVAGLGIDEYSMETEDAFCILPHGFFQTTEEDIIRELN